MGSLEEPSIGEFGTRHPERRTLEKDKGLECVANVLERDDRSSEWDDGP